jgi:hypothetical protein
MNSMSKIRVVLASLLMVAMFGAVTGPRAFANSQSNTVTFNVTGGNVTAIATCLNAVGRGGDNVQANGCSNYAYARGNVIVIRGVHINAVQANGATVGTPAQSNSLNFTVTGGNVTAVASCVNAVGRGGGNTQVNQCINTAIAIGNIIVLINVHIDAVQANG